MWDVGIGDTTEKELFAAVFLRVPNRWPTLHVEKISPWLGMIRKPLHERGITIDAGVGATNIRID